MKKRKLFSYVCFSIWLQARSIHAAVDPAGSLILEEILFFNAEYQDACPTEGTAFDSNFDDTSGSLCSAYWVGLKTKSIKKTNIEPHHTNCYNYFVPALFVRSQCERTMQSMWFSTKVILPG